MPRRDQPGKARKTFYFGAAVIAEILGEARRLDRNASWLIVYAWKLARAKIREIEPTRRDQTAP